MAVVVFIIFTVFWGVVGVVIPWFIPKSQNKGIIQTMLATTAACCYLHWLCTYMAQLNPLFGPQLSNVTLALIKKGWS